MTATAIRSNFNTNVVLPTIAAVVEPLPLGGCRGGCWGGEGAGVQQVAGGNDGLAHGAQRGGVVGHSLGEGCLLTLEPAAASTLH